MPNVPAREGAILLLGVALGLLVREGLSRNPSKAILRRPLRRYVWDDFCLLLVHVQRDQYSQRESVRGASPQLGANIATLVEACRAQGVEVVHLRDGSSDLRSPWYAFWQRMNPTGDAFGDPRAPEDFGAERKSERVFVSRGYDGVNGGTGLEQYLRSRGRSVVLVCGLTTSCGVHTNALGLFLRGYETFVVGDCCGDCTAKMHTGTLQRENRRSYAVCTLEGIKALLGGGPRFDLLAGSRFVAGVNATQYELQQRLSKRAAADDPRALPLPLRVQQRRRAEAGRPRAEAKAGSAKTKAPPRTAVGGGSAGAAAQAKKARPVPAPLAPLAEPKDAAPTPAGVGELDAAVLELARLSELLAGGQA